jgi:hypothetical protein
MPGYVLRGYDITSGFDAVGATIYLKNGWKREWFYKI